MPVNTEQWRAEIGSFNGRSQHLIVKLHLNLLNLLFSMFLVSSCIIAIDFKTKANHFNSFFASHCTPLNNNSKVPESQTYITDSKLSSLQFEDKDIIKIIRTLNINKAHGYDDISIRMLKIGDLAIIKPLSIIFRNCINNSTFPDLWKKSNISLFIKK